VDSVDPYSSNSLSMSSQCCTTVP